VVKRPASIESGGAPKGQGAMLKGLSRLIPFIVIGLLVWQPLWLLFAFLAPGIAIVEGATAWVSRFAPERVGRATGIHYGVPLTNIAIGPVPLAAIGFWSVTVLAWLAAHWRNRRKARRHAGRP
jgi:hypothetical protein